MPLVTINTDVLSSEYTIAYLDRADRRIRSGFRAALETLNIPLPEYAARKPTGVRPGKAIAAAFAADDAIHGDRTFTASGNRRNGDKAKPWVPETATDNATPASAFLFEQVFGRTSG